MDVHHSMTVTTAPAREPISLAEAKSHLHVTAPDDNSRIKNIITAVWQRCEAIQRRQYITATRTLRLDGFPTVIRLPYPPTQSVTSIGYTDSDGEAQTLTETTDFDVDIYTHPARITPAYGTTWPSTRAVPNCVTVVYVAGYGNTASSIPVQYRQAMLLMIEHWYVNTGETTDLRLAKIPDGAESILMADRIEEFN